MIVYVIHITMAANDYYCYICSNSVT